MTLIYSFFIGGIICFISQIIMDKFKLLPLHITCGLVILGGILDIFNIYDKLIEISGSGASLMISSFGHNIVHNTMESINSGGISKIFSSLLATSSSGIASAVIFSFFITLICKPHS